jgi:hypothetical protein
MPEFDNGGQTTERRVMKRHPHLGRALDWLRRPRYRWTVMRLGREVAAIKRRKGA